MLLRSYLYILLHNILDSGAYFSYCKDDSTQQSTKTFVDNHSETESQNTPGDPKRNNPSLPKGGGDKKDNDAKKSGDSTTKTPIYPNTPVKIYDDAEESKSDMLKDFKDKSIIYMWFNKITGKVYIGSSSNGSKRLSTYYQPTTLKKRSKIYQNIKKYGHSNFSVSILEVCGDSKTVNKDHYLAREQFYLDWALKTYGLDVLNILTIANSSLGYKHTEETLFYLSESRKGEKNPMFAKAKSEAFIAQQTKEKFGANNPMFGKSKTEETLAKLRKMIFVYDVTDNYKLLGVYPTVVCTRTFHIGYETLSKRLLDGKIHKGKYLFSRNPELVPEK